MERNTVSLRDIDTIDHCWRWWFERGGQRCGSSDFAEWCSFNSRFLIFAKLPLPETMTKTSCCSPVETPLKTYKMARNAVSLRDIYTIYHCLWWWFERGGQPCGSSDFAEWCGFNRRFLIICKIAIARDNDKDLLFARLWKDHFRHTKMARNAVSLRDIDTSDRCWQWWFEDERKIQIEIAFLSDQRRVSWKSKSDLSSTTKCDQNYIYLTCKFGHT